MVQNPTLTPTWENMKYPLLSSANLSPRHFSSLLQSCIKSKALKPCKQVHGKLLASGVDMNSLSLKSRLVGVYASCADLISAELIFQETQNANVFALNWMISAMAFNGYYEQAIGVGMIEQSLVLFDAMKLEGLRPNDFTWNALIAGYARKGLCDGAFALFSRMSEEGLPPDLVTWNAMISGLVQGQCAVEALEVFRDMLIAGIKPNHVTVTGLLPACALMNSIQIGKEIHGLIYRMVLYMNVFVTSALIDIYSKCGSVKDARNVFNEIPIKNVASWNAMIGCYGKHGLVDCAIQLFETMQDREMQANQVTLICVLSACSHGGLVEKGLTIFRCMREMYGIEASKEHYACVVDLLCRSGRVDDAYSFVKEMPIRVTDSIIGAFFNGCKVHNRRYLAEKIAEDILRMKLNRPGGLVTLSNIHASEGEWEEVENVRKMMKEKGVHKNLVSVGLRRRTSSPK
ncbi:unnamed protein product [Ilex paraguariensis]|uniref:Pentatricopeptide repeat-containing protein n=2 Tax=Ilex paraguariensis TaxID=185542 RepID=A0ABC8SEX5_9AQUA